MGDEKVVLVVVAEPELRQVVRRAVEELDHRAVLAASWPDANRQSSARPDVLIVQAHDVPYARQAATTARTNWRSPVPLIVLARRGAVRDVATLIGAVDIVRLPLNLGWLMAAIERALDATMPP